MKKIKKYVPFMKAGFHQASTYKLNLIFIILGNIIGCFVSFYLWKAVFDATDTSSFMGFNMVEMTTYVFISFVTNSIIGCNARILVLRFQIHLRVLFYGWMIRN